jgi:hypothetical protein
MSGDARAEQRYELGSQPQIRQKKADVGHPGVGWEPLVSWVTKVSVGGNKK